MRVQRADILNSIKSESLFDVLIIGGGIHGAACARLAARAGLKTALVERGDYAEATSSRSSKMAHGGLRYLEMFDFQQVFEGIKARENLFEAAPHIVKPERFLIPVPRGDWFFKIKLGLGLILYDLMVTVKNRRHCWIARKNLTYQGFTAKREDLEGCYMYTDGLMNDARLVIENVRGALENGAQCLNYVEATKVAYDAASGVWRVSLRDQLTDTTLPEARARVVLNCAGPWVIDLPGSELEHKAQLRFSRGSHVIFSKMWNGPSLFLPMEGKARYYFVWPHAAGTMVGTTERQVETAARDPLPSADEISEIFKRLEKDLPDSGLDRSSAHHCFAGVRTLPLRGAKKGTTTLSRKHKWIANCGMFSLVGGKFTTASWTSAEGVDFALSYLGKPKLSKGIRAEPLPGTSSAENLTLLVQKLSTEGKYSRESAQRLVDRFGQRAAQLLQYASGGRELVGLLTEGEVRYAIEYEQAECLDDLMRRRTDIEYQRGHGLSALDEICRIFKELRPGLDIERERSNYRERLEKINNLLQS